MQPLARAVDSIRDLCDPRPLAAAALLLSGASFSPELRAEARVSTPAPAEQASAAAPAGIEKQSNDGALRFFVDCGAIALVIGALRLINLQDSDFRKLEIAMAARFKEEQRTRDSSPK